MERIIDSSIDYYIILLVILLSYSSLLSAGWTSFVEQIMILYVKYLSPLEWRRRLIQLEIVDYISWVELILGCS